MRPTNVGVGQKFAEPVSHRLFDRRTEQNTVAAGAMFGEPASVDAGIV